MPMATVAQEVELVVTNRKIRGLIPSSASPHVKVALDTLGKLLNPKLLLNVIDVCVCE